MDDKLMFDFSDMVHKLQQERIMNLDSKILHAVLGICGETGEILDLVKKNIFYGKELDFLTIKEEIGDLLFYVQSLCETLGTSFDEIMRINIAKLKTRYPNGYNQQCALVRDKDLERLSMEKQCCDNCNYFGTDPRESPCNTCHTLYTGNHGYPKWEFKKV